MILLLLAGSAVSSLGVYVNPIRAELKCTGEQVSALVSAFLLASSVSSLVGGWLLDRFGAKWVMAVGVILVALGFVWAGVALDRTSILLGFAVSGIGYGMSTFLPASWIAGVEIKEHLGFVMGVFVAAAGLGSALLPPLVGSAIESFGWRPTLVAASCGIAAICLLLILAFVPRSTRSVTIETSAQLDRGALFREVTSPAFISINLSVCLFCIGYFGVFIFVVPFLGERGYSPDVVRIIYGVSNGIGALGPFLIGWLADRFNTLKVFILCLMLNGGVVFFLGLTGDGSAGSLAALGAFVLFWSLTGGAPAQLAPVLIAQTLGIRNFGALNGVFGVMSGVAMAAGPMLTGVIHDQGGGYLGAFYACALCVLAGGFVSPFIRARTLTPATSAPPANLGDLRDGSA